MTENTEYLSQEKKEELEQELKNLKEEKITDLAKRIDEARQMGDLSENAEYHSAREEMAWAQSRVKQIGVILDNAQIITGDDHTGIVNLGSVITVKGPNGEKEYTIVGGQEADPMSGKISNESPLAAAFLGKKKGDKVEVELPAGAQQYKITSVK